MSSEKLIIDWTQSPTYNTIMALLVGVSLISIAKMAVSLVRGREVNPRGWALNFLVLGSILTVTGLHMTLTWPMAKYFPYDNIIFGEPTLVFGVMNLVMSYFLYNNAMHMEVKPLRYVARHFQPFGVLFYAMGLMLVGIFFAGIKFQFFAAPKEEPISGNFAGYPWMEAWGMSLVFLGVGVASFLAPSFIKRAASENYEVLLWDKLGYAALLATGWFLLFFGALNYYTHIGLIVNTMP